MTKGEGQIVHATPMSEAPDINMQKASGGIYQQTSEDVNPHP